MKGLRRASPRRTRDSSSGSRKQRFLEEFYSLERIGWKVTIAIQIREFAKTKLPLMECQPGKSAPAISCA